MNCRHTTTACSDALPFSGPVSRDNQNPAAHGGVRYVDTCDDCGATRETLVNGRHEEVGAWGIEGN